MMLKKVITEGSRNMGLQMDNEDLALVHLLEGFQKYRTNGEMITNKGFGLGAGLSLEVFVGLGITVLGASKILLISFKLAILTQATTQSNASLAPDCLLLDVH
jgi:hypothetical protein